MEAMQEIDTTKHKALQGNHPTKKKARNYKQRWKITQIETCKSQLKKKKEYNVWWRWCKK